MPDRQMMIKLCCFYFHLHGFKWLEPKKNVTWWD